MSSTLLSNFLTADILEEVKLKPWFETFRGYLVFICLGLAVYMIYDVKSDNVINCVPQNDSEEFSAATTKYVNMYCFSNLFLDWHEREPGMFSLMCVLLIYLNYSWWLHVPSVRESFRSVRESDDVLKDVKGSKADVLIKLKHIFSRNTPLLVLEDEDSEKLLQVCERLWYTHFKHCRKLTLSGIFCIRNGIALILLGCSIGLSWHFYLTNKDKSRTCRTNVQSSAEVICFVTLFEKIKPCIVAIVFAQSILFLIAAISICCSCKYKDSERLSETKELKDFDGREIFVFGEECNQFVKMFSHYSNPLRSMTQEILYFSDVCNKHLIWDKDFFNHFAKELRKKQFKRADAIKIARKLRQMHPSLREGGDFKDFLAKHEDIFTFVLPQENICGCEALFDDSNPLMCGNKSLMCVALEDLENTNRECLAAHLIKSAWNKTKVKKQGFVKRLRNPADNHDIDIDPIEFLLKKIMNDSREGGKLSFPFQSRLPEESVLMQLPIAWNALADNRRISLEGKKKFEFTCRKIRDCRSNDLGAVIDILCPTNDDETGADFLLDTNDENLNDEKIQKLATRKRRNIRIFRIKGQLKDVCENNYSVDVNFGTIYLGEENGQYWKLEC